MKVSRGLDKEVNTLYVVFMTIWMLSGGMLMGYEFMSGSKFLSGTIGLILIGIIYIEWLGALIGDYSGIARSLLKDLKKANQAIHNINTMKIQMMQVDKRPY